jgi:predicted porin
LINKNVMAVAVAAALAAPVAAFAQASNVQIYGTMDMSFQNSNYSSSSPGAATAATAATYASTGSNSKTDIYSQSSRLGFKGTEDLGNGLKAWFQIENGVGADGRQPNTTTGWGSRNSGVGLDGNFGTVMVGLWDSPYKGQLGKMGAFSNGWAGHQNILLGNGDSTGTQPNIGCDNLFQSSGALTSSTANAGTTANNASICNQIEGSATAFHRRLSNSLQYWSPTIAGFQGKVAYQTNGQKVAQTATAAGVNSNRTSDPTLWSMSLNHTAGKLDLGLAYERHTGFRTVGFGNTSTTAGTSTSNNATDTGWMLNGSYDFGVAKLAVAYEQLKFGDTAPTTVANNNTSIASGSNAFDRNSWLIGVSAPIGNGKAYGGYSYSSGLKNCGNLGISSTQATAASIGNTGVGSFNNAFFCGGDTGATTYSLGYEHSLSKRTSVYVNYFVVDNKALAAFSPAVAKANAVGQAAANALGTDVSVTSLGMKHSF